MKTSRKYGTNVHVDPLVVPIGPVNPGYLDMFRCWSLSADLT